MTRNKQGRTLIKILGEGQYVSFFLSFLSFFLITSRILHDRVTYEIHGIKTVQVVSPPNSTL